MSRSTDVTIPGADRARARRGLTIFFSLVIVFAVPFVGLVVATGNLLWIFAYMWSVALSSIIARLVQREGFADVSFRFGGRRTLIWVVIGLLFPQVVGFAAFGFAWLTGLAPFVPPPGGFWKALLVASTIGTAFGVLTAAGEEIGWRGYMLIRLIDAGVPRPVLVSGVIWGLWHVPLIVTGVIYAEHPSTFVAVLVFMVSATAAACVLARARLETGSIWPCVVLHSAYNSVIQSAFWPAAPGTGAFIWVGMEAGILVAVVLVLLALALCRGRWTFLRTPDQLMSAPAAL
jgi:CAAX protease family protein